MHRNFADWYRTASLSPTKDELEARFAAVEAAAAAADKKPIDTIDLVEIVYGRRTPISSVAWFIDAMKGADPTLLLEDNENALAVLAGCTLAFLMSKDQSDWSNAANAVKCASFAGTRLPSVLPSLLHMADETIRLWQSKNRGQFDAKAIPLYTLDGKILEKAYTDASAGADQVIAAIKVVAQQATNALSANVNSLRDATEQLQHQTSLQREETDMLWWVLGGWVSGLNAPLSSISAAAAPLVIGWELGGLIRISPQPHALPAIIERALIQIPKTTGADLTVATAIQAVPTTLRAAWNCGSTAALARFGRVAPLTIALSRLGEDPTGWTSWFEQTTGVAGDTRVTAHRLAMQACAERTLIKQFAA